MAVTILERPEGYIINYNLFGTDANGSIIDSSGDALFNINGHGLSDGDIVYNIGNVQAYNGFWIVDEINGNNFKIKDPVTDAFIAYTKDCTSFIFYVIIKSHGWSCVHLPIVYTITNDLFPYGTPVNTILSFANDGGYVDITPTASLSGLFEILGFVRLEGTSVDGIYEIRDNSGSLVIDLVYDAGYVLAGGTMSVYYPNYHILVKIYGGLTDTHYWEDEKPYELVSTLRLTPDNNNECKFSVSNELKKQVKSLTNNLMLDTLPNNIDAFTMFYITTQESYDLSDGTEVTTFTGTEVSDKVNFEGFAVNAKLPFKNIQSGYLGDYLVDQDSVAAKFLTLFETPVMFDGYYFEISALLNYDNIIYYDLPVLNLKKIWVSTSGIESSPEYELITNYDAGLYRLQIDPDCNYSQLKIQITHNEYTAQQMSNSSFVDPLTPWSNFGSTGDWLATTNLGIPGSAGTNYAVNTSNSGTPVKVLRQTLIASTGDTLSININFYTQSVITAGLASDLVIKLYSAGVEFYSENITTLTSLSLVNYDRTIRVILTQDVNLIGFTVTSSTPNADNNYWVDLFTVFIDDETILTEQKTIDIACNCNDQGITGTQLTWLNYLGGMEYFVFTAQTEHQIDIKEAKTRMLNIFPEWPKSYGETANTMRQETMRKACFRKTLRSQLINNSNLEAMQYIKTSSLVQIMVSQTDLRTVLVDTDSFTVFNDNDKEFSISFNVEYTDYIPAQSL